MPPPSQLRHGRGAISFLEGLALWLNVKLHVVLSVDAKEAGSCLGLTDEMGLGMRSVYFDVEVHDRGARPRRGQRIRGIGVLIEKRLNALGISSYAQIANWSASEIDRISQTLDFKGRIERENWVEQARILSSGGQTEFSRRVDKGDVESSRDS